MDRLSYLEFLNEELSSEQKRRVDSWERGDHSFSDKAMNYTDKVRVPLIHHDDPTVPHAKVHEHLMKHGYEISDYKSGLAKDHYGRQVKIGKVLNKTEAPEEVKKTFENDSSRAVKKSQNYHVVISKHPHDVAGMSTGRTGWDSCMNMDTGENRRYLKNDIHAGTHVAYLVHKDDKDIDNPLARIALKPFSGDDGHTVLRPEDTQYGTGGDSFAHTVRKWSEDNFPMKKKQIYHKDRSLYDDSGKSSFMSNDPETLQHFADNGLPEEKALLAEHAPKEIIDHILHTDKYSSSQSGFRHAMIRRGIPEHLDHIMNTDPNENEISHILERHKRSKDLDQIVNHKSGYMRQDVAVYGTKRHHDALLNDPADNVRAKVAEHGDDSHRDHLVNDESPLVRSLVAKSGNKKHLNALMHDPRSSVRETVASRGHGHDHLVDDQNMYVRSKVAEHGEARHVQKLLQDSNPYVVASVAKNRKFPNVADKLTSHPDPEVRTQLAVFGNKDHLDKLVHDAHPEVRAAVAEHGHRSHLEILKNDEHHEVRSTARYAANNED